MEFDCGWHHPVVGTCPGVVFSSDVVRCGEVSGVS
jgi:hypothetical protein